MGKPFVVAFLTVTLLGATPFNRSLVADGKPNLAGGGAPASTGNAKLMANMVYRYTADLHSAQGAFELPASTEGLDRLTRLHRQWNRRLRGIDFEALDRDGKLDYVLLENRIARELAEIAMAKARLAEIEPLVGFRQVILELARAQRQAKPIDLSATAERLDKLARQVGELRKRIKKKDDSGIAQQMDDSLPQEPGESATQNDKHAKTRKPDCKAERSAQRGIKADDSAGEKNDSSEAQETPMHISPALALRAARTVQELQNVLTSWHKHYSGYKPQFDWWIDKPYQRANEQLKQYVKHLREEIAGQKGKPDDPLLGSPIGADALARGLRYEMLSYDADGLIAVGRRQLAWGEKQMKKAAAEMGFGDDWKAALSEVKSHHVPPGEQAELVARIGREATRFVVRRELVTVPPLCRASWRLTIMSPEQLETIPYAAYNNQRMLVAYAQKTMSQEDKLMTMRGNNRHFTRLVTPHELIPGHHLQLFHLARHNSHRKVFSTPFYIEGWALYWERRLWELGWADRPEDRMGMLFWWMTRAARITVSLNYHLGRTEPNEMVEFLVNRVGHERFGARAEVRRFIQAEPLYQVGYMIGGLQLDALHQEQVVDGNMTEREFHDAVLEAGPMPIALLRAWMQGQPLKAGMQPKWRFVGGGKPKR